MNQDFLDFVRALESCGARFVIVGAHAMAVHGYPRATGDLDVWVARDPENSTRVWEAFRRFGAPAEALGVIRTDLEAEGRVIQFGQPPRRIDVLTSVSGLEFDAAWSRRETHAVSGVAMPFLGRADLVANKRASGRAKDLADLEGLG